jgi:hypothetical protein
MGKRKADPKDVRSFIVMVRFKPGLKAVVEGAWKASGKATLSEFVRHCVNEYVTRHEGVKMD